MRSLHSRQDEYKTKQLLREQQEEHCVDSH